jgi:hypothetical protein
MLLTLDCFHLIDRIPVIYTLKGLKKDEIQKAICLFAQSYREQPLEVNVMVTVEQFCDVCMKNLTKPIKVEEDESPNNEEVS